ncbi:interleukin-20 receptor subunit alpha [Amia ocellicauda]|uniref:interleukin-20 receptor subunit alpha n=1 Tax=Amia ocellicauda TaxID=2972642 RepID=UPI003463FD57
MNIHCVILLIFIREAGTLPATGSFSPDCVQLSSKNLITILQWKPGKGSSSTTLYNVQYKLYGEKKWINGCQNIRYLSCDLTKEINLKDEYTGRVRAIHNNVYSEWVESQHFSPFHEMVIDPPTIKVTTGMTDLQITVTPPFQKKDPITEVKYKVNVKLEGKSALPETVSENSTIQILDLKPGEKYCISVIVKYFINTFKDSNPSDNYCVKLKAEKDAKAMGLILNGSLGLLGIILTTVILVAIVIGYKLIYRPKETMPLSLVIEESHMINKQSKMGQKDNKVKADEIPGIINSKQKKNQYVALPANQILPLKTFSADTDEVMTLISDAFPTQLFSQALQNSEYIVGFSCTGAPTDPDLGLVQIYGTVREYGNTLTTVGLHVYRNTQDEQNNQYANVQNTIQTDPVNAIINDQQRNGKTLQHIYSNLSPSSNNNEYNNLGQALQIVNKAYT